MTNQKKEKILAQKGFYYISTTYSGWYTSEKPMKFFRNIFYSLLLTLPLVSCQSDDEKALREKLASTELSDKQTPAALTPALINEYRQAELAINRRYINEAKSVVFDDFEKKLEAFDDNEFGVFRSYKHMFKVLIENKDELNDYWNLKKSKYFSNLTTHQKLHDCYQIYNSDIQELRRQISRSPRCKSIPKEVRYNIKSQDVSLAKINQHSYTNLAIEFGIDIAVWLLVMGIVAIISLVAGCAAPPAWILTIITIIASVFLSIYNDNHMINSIREQYQDQIELDNTDVLNELDKSTNAFYDYISK